MIQFENVRKVFTSSKQGVEHVAVEDFSLTVPHGTSVAMVGSSGCGKTTLLRMVNRMVEPTSGRVLLNGQDVADEDPVKLRRSIGYVLQNGGLLPHRTVAENIATVPLLEGVKLKNFQDKIYELLERVGLDADLAKRFPAELSGGQQQRVGVARALAAEPGVLLMDEPFGALDPIVRRELQEEVLRLHAELGKTMIFVTHDIDEAFLLGNRVVILREGARIEREGAPEEILKNPGSEFVEKFIRARRYEPCNESKSESVTPALASSAETVQVSEGCS
ncbi:ABC transporter ATP-binding protein [Arcanobacterium ihumii]|uniref:ABC transporter ATP-binding protein n=1 Tax=Arcanobacterium ihumii TaxID=2138162 RepID=UPI000F53AFCC|nr:ATP-binding cassette domain-containing protein [Arcanobacterium ihumii]